MKKLITSLIAVYFLAAADISSQNLDRHGCDFTDEVQITGPFKPLTTPNSFIRVLIVYVEFDKEEIEPGNTVWPPGGTIGYMGNLI